MSRLTTVLSAVGALSVLSFSGCSPGGPVAGPADSHCGSTVVTTSAATCSTPSDGGLPGHEHEHAVRFNAEGDDDDCKYHLKFSSTPAAVGADVTLTATLTRKSDQQPATGAEPQLEAFLSSTHPAPNANTTTVETSPGTYTVGPVRFDAPGRWTLEFHLFEDCTEADEASPHGHASFFFEVP